MGKVKTASRNEEGTETENGMPVETKNSAPSPGGGRRAAGFGGTAPGNGAYSGIPAWAGHRVPDPEEAFELLDVDGSDLDGLLRAAAGVRDAGHPDIVTFSPKVFIPLTELCRDVCHYCTFAKAPRRLRAAYLSPDEVLAIAEAGERAGCREALFTLGDKPELRYRAAREELARLGHETTIDYLVAMCRLVLEKTRLLPHVNPGVLTGEDMRRLRAVSVSAGIMLETASPRLCERGGVHYGSPDKVPEVRLATLRRGGEARVPFTTGILIGIGETRRERIESLLAIREIHERYGHIQEIIVQNFRAKPGTKMAGAPEPSLDDLLWTVAAARLVFGAEMSVQAPPNLSPGAASFTRLVEAGIDDWGGVSPVTIDHVNPEAPWPEVAGAPGRDRGGGQAPRPPAPRLSALPPRPGRLARPGPPGAHRPRHRHRGPCPRGPLGRGRLALRSADRPERPGRGTRPRASATWSTSRRAPRPESASARTRSCASSRPGAATSTRCATRRTACAARCAGTR